MGDRQRFCVDGNELNRALLSRPPSLPSTRIISSTGRTICSFCTRANIATPRWVIVRLSTPAEQVELTTILTGASSPDGDRERIQSGIPVRTSGITA